MSLTDDSLDSSVIVPTSPWEVRSRSVGMTRVYADRLGRLGAAGRVGRRLRRALAQRPQPHRAPRADVDHALQLPEHAGHALGPGAAHDLGAALEALGPQRLPGRHEHLALRLARAHPD